MIAMYSYSLHQVVENFTFSCSGYCVATYVLGIGNHHSDNIMLTKFGNVSKFHLQLEPFLIHRCIMYVNFCSSSSTSTLATSLGTSRVKLAWKKRVPFVLTNDFIYIIAEGGDEQNI